MTKTTHPNFPLVEGTSIQRSQLEEWATILKPEAMKELHKEAVRQNSFLTSTSDGNDVWRGIDIANYVHNDLTLMF